MHQRLVRRRQRVRQHHDLDLALAQALEGGDAQRAGDQVRRGQHQLVLRAPDLHAHRHRHAHLARFFGAHGVQLVRRVGEGTRRRPDQADAAGGQVFARRAVTQRIHQGQLGRRVVQRGQPLELGRQLRRRHARLHDGLHREDHFAVPVLVEDILQLADHRAHDEGVHVDEIAALVEHEIFVADVAPAGDGDHAVGDEQLVVHAVVDSIDVAERTDESARQRFAQAAEGVEQPHFDVRRFGQCAQHRVGLRGEQVVDQQAHAHAALAGVAQQTQQQAPGGVVVDDVVLQVQTVAGAPNQLQARVQRIGAQRQQPEAGQVARRGGGPGDFGQVACGRRRQRLGHRLRPGRRQCAAAGHCRRQQHGEQQRHRPAQAGGNLCHAAGDLTYLAR